MHKAIGYLEEAVRRDPRYAQAYAALAAAYDLVGMYEILPPDRSFAKAQEFANRALQLDETLSEAYTASSRRVLLAIWLGLRRPGLSARHRTGLKFRPRA
jgi:hypothetical protein